MALRNGLLVHGPTHWAAAVRNRDGDVEVASGSKPSLGSDAAEGVPGLRGVTKLAEAMAVIPLVKRNLPAAKLPMQDVKTLGAMGGAALVGQAIRSTGGRTFAREGAVGSGEPVPALFALRSGDLAAYHGVEHKSIAAYEQDGEAAAADQGARPLRLQPRGADARRGCRRKCRGPSRRATRPSRRGGGGARQCGSGRRGVRVVRAPRGNAPVAHAAQAGIRDPAGRRHTRAHAGTARGGPPRSPRSCA